MKLIRQALEKATTIPYDWVTNNSIEYLSTTPHFKILKRYFRNLFLLWLFGQLSLLVARVPPSHKKILIWYKERRNIGDALMDLSGRVLIPNEKFEVHLFADKAICEIFEKDQFISKTYSDISDLKRNNYEFIIFYEMNHRTIKTKIFNFYKLMFSSLFGFIDGIARNQTEFSFAAFNKIFDKNLSDDWLIKNARPYLRNESEIEKDSNNSIAICIGGIEKYKTFDKWDLVISELDKDSRFLIKEIYLLGSKNGLTMAERIEKLNLKNIRIINLVDKTKLLEARDFIRKSYFVLTCDGGLMHITNTTQTPSIKLLPSIESSKYYLTESNRNNYLYGSGAVSDITITEIINEVAKLNKKFFI